MESNPALSPADVWAEMRLHMEWSAGFSLCVLFAPSDAATQALAQWADDAWAWRTAPMTRVNPSQPEGAAQAVLQSLHAHHQRWGAVRAPVWVSLLAQDPAEPPPRWDAERASLLALLNESREWLLREFASPLVLNLPTPWAGRVAALAPDLWHVRAYTAEVAMASPSTPASVPAGDHPRVLTPSTETQALTLDRLRQAVQSARQRTMDADASHHNAALREWVLALWALSEHGLEQMLLPEAHAAAVDSVALMRQLRVALGEGPQVLRDLSVSLE
ncbi:MAG TPA: hypothetical protein VFY35_17055, partial [Burkholderiaceae bacterium]|nr:hypothetical protein [Burkholderiaceae bacterium]